MRWPSWLRPGGALRDQYDQTRPIEYKPDVIIGSDALKVARELGQAARAAWGISGADAVAAFDQARQDPDAGNLRPTVEDAVRRAMTEPMDVAVLTNPAPGLQEALSGPMPSWSELRARYPEKDQPRPAPPEVSNLHPAAGSVQSQLADVLGRPTLAAKLAEQLDPETALILANRLHELTDRAARNAVEQVNHDVHVATTLKIAEIENDRISRAKEASRERFTGRSRFS